VFAVCALAAMIWLETLVMRVRGFPEVFFVAQPPTHAESFAVQRFQASLSAFTLLWNYLALIAIVFWALFYLAP
jgi:hypothetical protein